ncbi:MAG: MBL fold metallo-hydrolase [Candidatus Limnocylindrales bacterium]
MDSFPRLAFLGHSTVLIEHAGLRILTDPVLLDRVTLLRRVAPSVDPALHADIDLVLLSHLHLDHFDLPSLRLLGPGVRLAVPRGAGALLRAAGFHDVHELAAGERLVMGPLTVTGTPAVHGGYRPPLGPRAAALGFLLEAEGWRTYFAGDTDLFAGMADLAPGLDVALLPVWGWGPGLGPGHLDPGRAATAMRLLRPRFAVPIHWGTLWPYGLGRVRPERLSGPPREFAALADRDQGQVLVTPPGQRVSFPAR